MHEPDPATLRSAQRGDLGAFDQLVQAFQADLWRFCIGLLRDEAKAEDAVQETFLKMFRHLDDYRGRSKFSTWLFSIARNCAYDELRRSARSTRTQTRLEMEPPRGQSDETSGVEVREALAELPVELREPVVLIDVFGDSYKDAALVMGLPVGTVKSRVHRARERLARALGMATEAEVRDG
ncbi:MAG: RNA polymerase sigma factor [Actinomycetota bacterium]